MLFNELFGVIGDDSLDYVGGTVWWMPARVIALVLMYIRVIILCFWPQECCITPTFCRVLLCGG